MNALLAPIALSVVFLTAMSPFQEPVNTLYVLPELAQASLQQQANTRAIKDRMINTVNCGRGSDYVLPAFQNACLRARR